MARYHINPETGNPGVCRASKNCPFGDLAHDHYNSKEDATKAFETKMAGQTVVAPQKTTVELPQTYDFPANRLDYALSSIKRANKRAAKAGIKDEITHKIDKYDVVTTDEQGLAKIEERVKLTINRPALQHDGWTFAGKLTWDEKAGMVSRLVPGEKLLDRPRLKECDVCKTTRHRQDTYIVQKAGDQKQVGSNCLAQFMGIKPAGLWMLDYELDVNEKSDQDFVGKGGKWYDERKDAKQMLGIGLALTETYGWTARSAAYGDRIATVDRLNEILMQTAKTAGEKREHERLIARGEKLAKQAEELLTRARKMSGDSDYAQNMRAVAGEDTVSIRNLPLLLSAIGSQQNEKEREIVKQEKRQSEWQGEVGEKITPTRITVEDVKTIEQGYGYNRSYSELVTMKDQSGNIYKSFYSGSGQLKKGKSYVLTGGTVKAHNEWQEAKETMLTRMKFESVRPSKYPKTELPKKSLYRDAWTVEENAQINTTANKEIVKEIKKRAGRDGWDKDWDRPVDPELVRELDDRVRETNVEFNKRYREIAAADEENDE